MKSTLCVCLLAFGSVVNAFSQKLFPEDVYKNIENPAVTQVNQEPGRNLFVPFSQVADAIRGDAKQSNLFCSLNGNWKFNWFENYEKSIKNFYSLDFKDHKWRNIIVPGNWEMQGYGDCIFRNTQHPFVGTPPFVPRDYNPVGLYRKRFKLPADWKGKEVFLNIEAVSSASFVWVNGREVGYNAGAFEPSEYNITSYLKAGENQIAVQVFTYSAGTYLEDQDYWRLSGIFRDVYLVARPTVYIQDFVVITDLYEQYKDAQLSVDIAMKGRRGNDMNCQIEASLLDATHEVVCSEAIHVSSERARWNAKIRNPAKWTAETPNLYTLVLKLLDESKNVTEVVSRKIGFREVEIKGQVMYVNGAPVKLNGVNTHMQHPTMGHAMDIETMRKDLLLMKQFNINCVRTSHYPPNKEYLDLTDELGLYVVDEVGDEAHATEYLSEKEEWAAAYINRAQRMVLRDRSHPSIIFWSAGNESGFGNNICKVIETGKMLDPTRAWMYGGNTDDPAWANEVACEEIIGPRYPTPAELKYRIAMVPESQDPRPSFMDEYIAATGNGMGGLDEYWDVIWEYPRCIGGAIWDWVSPGLKQKVRVLKDASPNAILTSINGHGNVVNGKQGKAVQLSGFDQWIDVYRHPALDITGNELTLSLRINPQAWNGNGDFLTKGSLHYGLVQSAKDSVLFYIGTDSVGLLKVKVPENWYDNWHHLVGIYTGEAMELYIDGERIGQKPHKGELIKRPFPVNLGRNAELIGQDYTRRHSNAIIDEVGIFNKCIAVSRLLNPNDELIRMSALWLDLDAVEEKGTYFSLGNDARSYGLIWPDRTPQPELWQVKKSAQPVLTQAIDLDKGLFKVTNRHRFTNLNEFETVWKLYSDGEIIQRGVLEISVPPMESASITVPFQKPNLVAGVEYRLLISYTIKEPKAWADKGFEIAWEEFALPYKVDKTNSDLKVPLTTVTEDGSKLVVSGKNFSYLFDTATGKLISLNYKGKELIKEGPALKVWRAPLANELDAWGVTGANLVASAGMGNDVANAWRTAGLDQLQYRLDKFSYIQKSESELIVDVRSHSEGINYKTIFEEQFTYYIWGNGEVKVVHRVLPQGFMPAWIPCIGNQWVINNDLSQIHWYGKGPFENYPDRKTGAKTGVYTQGVEDMEEPYLVPQDNGLRTDVRWVRLESKQGCGIEFKGEKWFDFSAQRYDTNHLSRARYPFQLQPTDGITFNFNYATSGLGCTSASVLNQYRVMPGMVTASFTLRPYGDNEKNEIP